MYGAHVHVSLQATKQLHMQAKETIKAICLFKESFKPQHQPHLSLTREATCFPKAQIMANMDHIDL
jgi:hypothetical protein